MIILKLKNAAQETEIDFPCLHEHIRYRMEEIGLDGANAPKVLVREVKAPRALSFLEGLEVNVDEINYLANEIESLEEIQAEKLYAIIAYKGYKTPKDLINAKFNLDCYTLIQDVRNLEKIGRMHLSTLRGGLTHEELETTDFAKIGRELLDSGKGIYTQYGILFPNEEIEYKEAYDGQVFPEGWYGFEKHVVEVEIGYNGKSEYTYYIQFTNNTGNVLSSVSWSFNRVQELFYNEVSEYFDVLKKRTFIFNAPVDGNYEITELASGLTHSTDVPRINNTYYLSAGEHYIVIEGDLHASLRTKCCVRLATQKIYVNGGQGNGFAGNAKSIFIEFTPKLTANYKFNLPTGIVQFSELIKDKPEDEPLFVGCKVYNSTVNDVLRRRCKLAGISTISVHGLRHTHASLLLFAGVSIASVARRLGHASINTTQKTYLHTQWCTLEKCNVKN